MSPRTRRQEAGITHVDFLAWKQDLDAYTYKKCGMGIDDLPDMSFRSAFDAGTTPEEFFDDEVREHLEEMGWEDDNG